MRMKADHIGDTQLYAGRRRGRGILHSNGASIQHYIHFHIIAGILLNVNDRLRRLIHGDNLGEDPSYIHLSRINQVDASSLVLSK